MFVCSIHFNLQYRWIDKKIFKINLVRRYEVSVKLLTGS